MSKRVKFGALAGAALLTFAATSIAFAVKPAYDISITKTAAPLTLPVGGGSVTYTVTVENTGTHDFQGLSVSDNKCTLTGGKDVSASDKFVVGEILTYTCTVTITANTTNTASASGCHDSGQCNSGNADVTKTASVTVAVAVAPTASPTKAPTAAPAAATVKATVLNTATIDSRTSSTDGTWLAVIALGVLLASVVILTPRRSKSRG